MIGKGVIDVRPLMLCEVAKMLEKRQGTAGEFGLEQQLSLDYARRFSHLKYSDAKKMLEELSALEIKTETAVKIVDILPKNKSQLLLILAKDKIDLPAKKLEQVQEIVLEYSKKAKKFEPKAKSAKESPATSDAAAAEAQQTESAEARQEAESKEDLPKSD